MVAANPKPRLKIRVARLLREARRYTVSGRDILRLVEELDGVLFEAAGYKWRIKTGCMEPAKRKKKYFILLERLP